MTSAVFAFCTRQIVLGALILSYVQMQLSEMMIWYGIDKDDLTWNKRGTSFGKYLLATHNIALGLGVLFSLYFVSKQTIKPKDFIPLIIGVLFFIYIVVFVYLPKKFPDVTYPHKKVCKNDCQSPENRLKWPYPHAWYSFSFIISVIIMFVWIKPQGSRFIFLFIFSLSFLIAGLIYPNTVGSVWCWSASFIAPAIVIINYYFIRNESNSNLCT